MTTPSVAENFRAALRAAGGDTTTVEESVARHEVPENKISLPAQMTYSKGSKVLAELATADQEEQEFSRTFRYRPWDGAVATHNVMKEIFGTAGRGMTIHTFFGSQRPQVVDVEVAYGQTIQVPWGAVSFEPLEGVLDMGATQDSEYGLLYRLEITAKKKYAKEIEVFFNLIQEELDTNSIYKGKAIRGTDHPRFLDGSIDGSIVFNRETESQVNSYITGVIRHSDKLRDSRIKVDPKVLLHGTFGTGKSELGRMVAREATENGWTFIMVEPGRANLDDLQRTLQTARLMAPCVVWVEDIDIFMDKDERKTSQLLELFDGISSKGHEAMILMTTNHLDKLTKGSIRAGRINKMIEIGHLDREATERLIRTVCGDVIGEVDFDAVYEAVKEYEPSFIRQTFDDAKQAALINSLDDGHGGEKVVLNTQDFIDAANVMRTQHTLFRDKELASEEETLETLVGRTVTDAILANVAIADGRDNVDLELVRL